MYSILFFTVLTTFSTMILHLQQNPKGTGSIDLTVVVGVRQFVGTLPSSCNGTKEQMSHSNRLICAVLPFTTARYLSTSILLLFFMASVRQPTLKPLIGSDYYFYRYRYFYRIGTLHLPNIGKNLAKKIPNGAHLIFSVSSYRLNVFYTNDQRLRFYKGRS